ncbi:MAG TPA: 5-formyltetrahydrofolate cyclo-ligase [Burkholderiales bacterium]|nr:5-formyltetrahydrofolate cyclo-ligase [Burkholderiales bacterium]
MSAAIQPTGSKSELRRRLREQRRALTPIARRAAAEELASLVSATRAFRVARRIACYAPADGEIDTAPLMKRMARLNKRCYVPVLSRIDYDRLWFAPADTRAVRAPNRFGILEPRVSPQQLVRARELDLILLPLVAFDETGQRLGMGGGFFDRSLAFLAWREHWRKPHLIGLAYDFQKVAALPRESWDVPLDAVVTERNVYVTPAV